MASSWMRSVRGKTEFHKPLLTGPNAWFEPTGGAVLFHDFIVDDIGEDSTVVVNQSGTATAGAAVGTAAGPQSGHLGWLAGSTDNVDAEIDEVALGAKPWALVSASSMTIAEVGFVIPSALTARQYFIGFSDDETEGTATNGPLNIQTGTTVVDVAADAAGFIYSSLATDADGFYAASVKGGGTGVATNTGLTGVVDDYTRLRVEVDSAGNAYFYGGIVATGNNRGHQLDHLDTDAAAVATTAVLIPIFTAAATTTTAVEWEIDYMLGAAGAV